LENQELVLKKFIGVCVMVDIEFIGSGLRSWYRKLKEKEREEKGEGEEEENQE
jgi:hypothetical protein